MPLTGSADACETPGAQPAHETLWVSRDIRKLLHTKATPPLSAKLIVRRNITAL